MSLCSGGHIYLPLLAFLCQPVRLITCASTRFLSCHVIDENEWKGLATLCPDNLVHTHLASVCNALRSPVLAPGMISRSYLDWRKSNNGTIFVKLVLGGGGGANLEGSYCTCFRVVTSMTTDLDQARKCGRNAIWFSHLPVAERARERQDEI